MEMSEGDELDSGISITYYSSADVTFQFLLVPALREFDSSVFSMLLFLMNMILSSIISYGTM